MTMQQMFDVEDSIRQKAQQQRDNMRSLRTWGRLHGSARDAMLEIAPFRTTRSQTLMLVLAAGCFSRGLSTPESVALELR